MMLLLTIEVGRIQICIHHFCICQINDFHFIHQEKIFKFDVAMNNSSLMKIFKRAPNLTADFGNKRFRKTIIKFTTKLNFGRNSRINTAVIIVG